MSRSAPIIRRSPGTMSPCLPATMASPMAMPSEVIKSYTLAMPSELIPAIWVAFICWSRSISSVLLPWAWRHSAKAMEQAVLPTPPLWFTNAIFFTVTSLLVLKSYVLDSTCDFLYRRCEGEVSRRLPPGISYVENKKSEIRYKKSEGKGTGIGKQSSSVEKRH